MSDAPIRVTPLHDRHVAAGARMVPFAGFDMPVLYGSILEEHRAVREAAGVFDVSHMGEVRLRGRDAVRFAQRLVTNEVVERPPGSVRYGLMCQDDAGVIDDVTVYCVGPEEALLCINASRIDADLAWIRGVHAREGFQCTLEDESEATALLAVQGPKARAIVHRIVPEAPRPKRWHFAAARFGGAELWLSRTGYTGEDGYEIFLPASAAAGLWDALITQGVAPAGLGARDTLRTEAAYPLYGHELDLETNALEAGQERFVAFGRGFIGEPALLEVKRRGPKKVRVGLLLEGRAAARTGTPILAPSATSLRSQDGPVGVVTSGTYAPSIERSIAIGYVPAEHAAPGTSLAVEIRGRRIECRVTETPFYRKQSQSLSPG